MCDRECSQKCEIEDLRQLHLSWGCDFKTEIRNFPHVQTIAEMTEYLVSHLGSCFTLVIFGMQEKCHDQPGKVNTNTK